MCDLKNQFWAEGVRHYSIAGLGALLAACGATDLERERPEELPREFVKLRDVDPTILQDMRYFGSNNFVGRPIAGYEAGACVLTEPAARALSAAQAEFAEQGHSLIVFDCYRPQRAVDDFVAWASNDDEATKAQYYPNVPKGELFERGYIAERSGHSRGSTVDLALVPATAVSEPTPEHLQTPCLQDDAFKGDRQYLNFGTSYDCFDVLSHTANAEISAEAQANRQLLVRVLEERGFRNYANEWWHFTLENEPFADTYFDFAIK